MHSLLYSRTASKRHRQTQRGVALYVVIVLVMLSMLIALWAARSALFNELVVGNDADYNRTFEAAQAMLQDAEFDIRGTGPDGRGCKAISGNTDVCRPAPAAIYFDMETQELEKVLDAIETAQPTVKCFKGICQKRTDPQDFWNDKTTLETMMAEDVGARYGQFTGADITNTGVTTGNPILANRTANEGAWYWVELLPYVDTNVSLLGGLPPGSNVERFAPARRKMMIYRITALARGLKPNSEVVLQSTLSVQVVE